MNKIISVLLLGFGLYSTSYAHFKDDDTKDIIAICSKENGIYLTNQLKIYNNVKMEGKASYVMDCNILKGEGSLFSFKEIFACKLNQNKGKECLVDSLNNFLKITTDKVGLIISHYEKPVAKVKINKKDYFLKIEEADFKNKSWPVENEWKKLHNKEASQEIESLITKDVKFNKLWLEMKKCAELQSITCLAKLDESNKQIAKMFKYRSLADTPALCEKFKKGYGDYDAQIMDDLLEENKVQDSKSTWHNFISIFGLDVEKNDIVIATRKFGEIRQIFITKKYSGKLPCGNDIDFEIVLSKGYSDDSWSIVSFSSFGINHNKGVIFN